MVSGGYKSTCTTALEVFLIQYIMDPSIYMINLVV